MKTPRLLKLLVERLSQSLLLGSAALSLGCGSPAQSGEAASNPSPTATLFRDVTESANLDFVHVNGGGGKKYLPEIMGSGGCVLDFDGDGWMDVYLVQSGRLPGSEAEAPDVGNQLYRNRGDGTFEDVTQSSGAGHTGYGMGAVAGDYDNDGDPDIYVANLGPDALLRNDGKGSFTNVAEQAGIDSPLWGSSAAFFDAEGDGDLDLYVVNYLDFTVPKHIDCGTPSKGILSYCSPDVYPMAPDVFYRNRGDGTFEDATKSAGFVDTTGKGLGVVAADFNGDGRTDVYVANDSTPNFLYVNRGGGEFEESGLILGVGYNEDGLTEAGMGTDSGDVNGDGRPDIFVTNLSNETNALYLGGDFDFTYQTRAAGLYDDSFLPVGFGADLLDVDNDGDLDILVTNGHIIDNIELIDDVQTFKQPTQVFVNDGKAQFKLMADASVGDVSVKRVGRGTLTLDFDNDGRLDVLVVYNNDRARLFRNVWPAENGWIGFELTGDSGNRDAFGALVRVEAGGRVQVEEKKSASGYQTSNDPRLHFGLGTAEGAGRVTVQWPGGGRQVFENLRGNRRYRLIEGRPEPQ